MTRAATPDEMADHDRDLRKHDFRPVLDKRLAVARLVAHAEAIAESGLLDERNELKLRETVAETLAAFGMPSKVDREQVSA